VNRAEYLTAQQQLHDSWAAELTGPPTVKDDQQLLLAQYNLLKEYQANLDKYSPSQPRGPKGSPIGGQFVHSYGGDIASEVTDDSLRDHGVTVTYWGHHPTSGLAFSAEKGREQIVDAADMNRETVAAFVARNQELLWRRGNYIGVWEDDGKFYLDVSRVGGYDRSTLEEARKADQLAVFDLDTFTEIPSTDVDEAWAAVQKLREGKK